MSDVEILEMKGFSLLKQQNILISHQATSGGLCLQCKGELCEVSPDKGSHLCVGARR